MKNSILAGVAIALGGIAFLSVDDKVIGSFLFSIGLLSVLIFRFDLYTGKACNMEYYLNPIKLVLIWIGNFIGSAGTALLMYSHTNLVERASAIVNIKMQKPIENIMVDSVLCGICIAIAVKGYMKAESFGKYLMVILGVMVFILTGSEHCIADIFYIVLAHNISFYDAVTLLFTITIFNTVGGCLSIIALEKLDGVFVWKKKK